MIGISTQLNLKPEEASCLEGLMLLMNQVSRQAYQRISKNKMALSSIRIFAISQGLTNDQAKSVISQVEGWLDLDKANRKNNKKSLEEIIQGIKAKLSLLNTEIETLEAKPTLAKKQKKNLEFLKQSVFQKHRRQYNLQQRLDNLDNTSNAHIFGGEKLLSKRSRIEASDKEALSSWNYQWKSQRDKSVVFVGGADQSYGNQTAQIDLSNKTLTLRLTETQAVTRIKAEAKRLKKPFDKVPQRLSLKRITMDVHFKQEHLLRQAQALNLPITVQIKHKLTPKGEKHRRQGKNLVPEDYGYYVHASFNLPAPPTIHKHQYGVLGIDQNSWGLSWCIVKPDGNIASSEGVHLKGDIPIQKNNKTSDQIQAQVHEAVKTLTELAEKFHCAIGIEDLDFSRARNHAREKGKGYAKMIHALNTAKLKESLHSRCLKRGIALHQVDPKWTSVSGYVKYGLKNNLSVDQAAGMTIARKALLGKHWKPFPIKTHSKEGKPLSEWFKKQLEAKQDKKLFEQTIYYKESVNPSQSFPEVYQRINFGSLGWTWKDWQRVLGKGRTTWKKKLTSFPDFLLSLEAFPATAEKLAPLKDRFFPAGEDSAWDSGVVLANPGLQKQTVPKSTDLMNG